MIGYVTVGADDLGRAERFYSAFLPQLGFKLETSSAGLSYAMDDDQGGHADFFVVPPFDGQPASVGNGMMVAFSAPSQAMVRALHAQALAAGGRDEGAPGFRAQYSTHFYVGYLRDPQGNKIALVCTRKDEALRPD